MNIKYVNYFDFVAIHKKKNMGEKSFKVTLNVIYNYQLELIIQILNEFSRFTV